MKHLHVEHFPQTFKNQWKDDPVEIASKAWRLNSKIYQAFDSWPTKFQYPQPIWANKKTNPKLVFYMRMNIANWIEDQKNNWNFVW